MSSRYDRDDLPVLPEEDDWFATPFQEQPMETDEVAWQDDEPPPPRPAPDGLAQRQIVIVLAVLAIIAVIVILILLVRAVSGSDDPGTTTTPVTTATTPADTTPANTTPADTTPTATTPTATTPTDTTSTNTTPTGGNVTSVPTEATLRAGTTGSSVTDLQNALNQLGYDVGTADGNYGAATTAAVTAFQKDKGLTQDGTAGPTTLAAINTALAAG